MKEHVKFLVISSLVVALFQYSSPINFNANSIPQTSLSETEEWVLDRILSGEIADLSISFEEDKRVLSARFIEELLTDPTLGDKIPRQGIRIYNAKFIDNIDINNADVQHEVWLIKCRFEQEIDFGDSHFHKDLILNDSQFTGNASFYGLKVDGNLYIISSRFSGDVSLYFAQISDSLIADDIEFLDPQSYLSFLGLEVGNTASFENAQFYGEADFSYSKYGIRLLLNEAHFHNDVTFNTMTAGLYAFYCNAIFNGEVDFIASTIGKSLLFSDAVFTNPDTTIQFDYLEVGESMYLWDTVFNGGADFFSIQIQHDLYADGVQFTNNESFINFSNASIGYSTMFKKALFAGKVHFRRASIGTFVDFTDSHFTNSDFGPQFDYITIGNSIYLKKTEFSGEVNFGGSYIGADFIGSNALFSGQSISLNLSEAEVGEILWLDYASFGGDISLEDSRFHDVIIWGKDPDARINEIDLSRTKIGRDFRIKDVSLQEFIAPSLESSGNTLFTNLSVINKADLENSNFNTLRLNKVSWPASEENFLLGGLTYNRIIIDNVPPTEGWRSLLQFLNQASYDAQIYSNLEDYLDQEGNSAAADKIYVEQQRREKQELLHWSSLSWWWHGFLDIFVFYGRSPGRVFFWGLLIVLIGSLIFREESMTYSPDRDNRFFFLNLYQHRRRRPHTASSPVIKRERYHARSTFIAFWYSLDLFLPIIDLKMEKMWLPKPGHRIIDRFRDHYRRIHIILGWFSVSIGLLAIAGIIK